MATLTGQQIDQSYLGLLKTNDNAAIGATPKAIQDGAGGATNIEIGTTATNFVSGTVDFSGSTVSGLPAGSAGLESGTGTDSMQSAASLTTTAANASATNAIAMGESVNSAGDDSTAIGSNITSTNQTKNSVIIGTDLDASSAGSDGTVVIGHGSKTVQGRTVAIGFDVDITSGQGQAIGNDIDMAGADRSTAIGSGINIDSTGSDKIAIGTTMSLTADRAIGVGRDVTVSGDRAVSIGDGSTATASGSVALGKNVTAATVDTVSVKALETQTDGGVSIKGDGTNAGKLKLFCEDAGGAHNITLEGPAHAGGATYGIKFPNVQSAGSQILEADSSGNLAWINTPSGGGGAAGLVNGTGTSSLINAAALTASPAVAPTTGSIALGDAATIEANASRPTWTALGHIAIGKGSLVEEDSFTDAYNNACIAIGDGAKANPSYDGGTIAIGDDAHGEKMHAVAIGANTSADQFAIAMGQAATASGGISISIGRNSDATSTNGIAFGEQALASATDAVAIGKQVTAATANTVSVKALETQTDSTPTAGGIIMSDAGGTDRRLNINASGGLQIDSSPVGAATQFELSGFTVPANAASDICYAVVTIPANTFAAGDILEFRSLEKRDSLNNTVYESYWFSTQSQTVGSAVQSGTNSQQAGIQTSSNGTVYYQKTLWIGASGTTVYPYGRANETSTGVVQSGDPVETQTIDWTTTQYFYYQGWSDATVGLSLIHI